MLKMNRIKGSYGWMGGCMTWYTDENKRYHYHKTCILTGEFLEAKEKCDEGWKRYWEKKDAHDREYPTDHII